MSLEQAVANLGAHLDAERVILEQLYYLLEHEWQALRTFKREDLDALNQQKICLLQEHHNLLQNRYFFLSPFTPPTGEMPTLSYICYYLPEHLSAYLRPMQEHLRNLAITIKEQQARNEQMVQTAIQMIKALKKTIEEQDPEKQQEQTYNTQGKLSRIPRGKEYGKG